jgi:PAS domain S-box-containing protein
MQEKLRNFKRRLRLAFLVPLLLAIALGGVLVLQTNYLRDSLRDVEHSYRIGNRSRSLMKSLIDMANALRGYQLTGEKDFLHPYRDLAPQIEPAFEELLRLTAGNSRQQQLLAEMKQDYGKWHQFSTRVIEMREKGGSVSDVALNSNGEQIMDDIQVKRDELLQIEGQSREGNIERVRRNLARLFVTTVALSLFIGLVIATFSRRELVQVAGTYHEALQTSYRRTEELHENQQWLGAVLGSIADGVIATDIRGNMIFSNAVATAVLGMAGDRAALTPTSDAIHLFDEYSREAIPDPFQQVMQSQQPFSPTGHLILLHGDGREIPVMLTASPIRGEGGQISGVVIVLRDMTEQRRSERGLQSAEKLASIGRIATTVAHEIHNPLDALGNLLYLVEHSDSLTDPNRTYIRLAREELERVTSISEQMLAFSRETRQMVQVQLSEVIENVLTLYAARIRRAGVVVVKDFADPGVVTAFPGEMRQVFSNLVGNALDAMNARGKLTLRIEQGHDWDDNSETGVRVLICDTGTGVPFEVRAKLMEPFVTSKGEKGTGLGLWVCRGILDKYRGQLRYHTSTTPGRSGTCFLVFLPAARQATQRDSLAGQRAS